MFATMRITTMRLGKNPSIGQWGVAKTACLMVLSVSMTPAYPQLAEHLFKAVIERAGDGCGAVAKTQPIGTTSNGDALVAVACSNGGRHVVQVLKDNSVAYVSSCSALKAAAGISCFSRK